MNKFITCDIGKKETYVFVPETKNHFIISNEEFIHLNIPELDGHDIVIEDAHIRAQEDDSLAQSWTIDQLRQLRNNADSMNTEILCFPQKVTPKARKIASIGLRSELLDKTDKNDIESIAFYHQEFPEAYDALKVFDPVEYKTFEKKVTEQKLMTKAELNKLKKNIEKEIEDAVEFGLSSPLPPQEVLYEDVYVNYSNDLRGLR